MTGWQTTLTAAVVGSTPGDGPFPPSYYGSANGYTAAVSNPNGASAGALSLSLYFGATIVAIANDSSSTPTEVLFALEGSYDQTFIGNLTTPDGKVYSPSQATFVQSLVGSNTITTWIWPLASGGSALANGTVALGNTGDTLVSLSAYSDASTQINLSWTNTGPEPPSNYLLYRDTTGGVSAPVLYQTLGGTTYLYEDTGLTASAEYIYYVVASYSDGSAATSATISIFTPASGIAATFNCNFQALTPDGWTLDTLANLRARVAINSGFAAQANNLPAGMKALINEKLRTAQNQLYRQHWERKNIRLWAWQMEINQRYYGLTQDEDGSYSIDPLSVEWVGFEDLNQAWYKLIEGIDPILYTRAQISTGWPTHYEIRECIEIFPAPKAQYTLWVKGRFALQRFTQDTDVTTIDCESVMLLATGMVLASRSHPDAQNYMTQALNYTKYLVAAYHRTARYVPRTRVQTPMTPPVFLPGDGGAPIS